MALRSFVTIKQQAAATEAAVTRAAVEVDDQIPTNKDGEVARLRQQLVDAEAAQLRAEAEAAQEADS